ncbi:transcriptional regulator, TetR family protein [Mycobacterium kansasii]|uniref:Transcriptional regulator, TetR family protein n=1 Tax=Mycobacterium kansasii TaxID=1768 RepID=A0A1V3X471_MYCKA|nr:transcriptional regulator, TetR family protein [Mycobacterium kansasii]
MLNYIRREAFELEKNERIPLLDVLIDNVRREVTELRASGVASTGRHESKQAIAVLVRLMASCFCSRWSMQHGSGSPTVITTRRRESP